MCESAWPQHQHAQRDAACTDAADAGAGRASAGSKDGSLGKWCEGFDQVSRSARQPQITSLQASACLVALDALIRAPLPTRSALVEGSHVHCSMDPGT